MLRHAARIAIRQHAAAMLLFFATLPLMPRRDIMVREAPPIRATAARLRDTLQFRAPRMLKAITLLIVIFRACYYAHDDVTRCRVTAFPPRGFIQPLAR